MITILKNKDSEIFFISRILVMFFVVMNIIGSTYISLKTRSREKILDEELKTGLNINDANVERRLKPNTLEKIFNCFFIMNNFRFIMSNEVSKLSIPAIHGIRLVGIIRLFIRHLFIIVLLVQSQCFGSCLVMFMFTE